MKDQNLKIKMTFKRIVVSKFKYPESINNWYSENIEKPLIPLVKYLRNNGVNTTGSCAHDKFILFTATSFNEFENIKYVSILLTEFGIKDFEVKLLPDRFNWLYKITIKT